MSEDIGKLPMTEFSIIRCHQNDDGTREYTWHGNSDYTCVTRDLRTLPDWTRMRKEMPWALVPAGVHEATHDIIYRREERVIEHNPTHFYKVDMDDYGSVILPTVEWVKEELEIALTEGEVGSTITVTVVEMTQAQYDALPEHEGW